MRKGSFFDGFLREKGVDIIAGGGGGVGGSSMAGEPLRDVLPIITVPYPPGQVFNILRIVDSRIYYSY